MQTNTKATPFADKKWFGRIDPFDGQMILIALAAVGGTLWSIWHFFVWPNTISTGGFTFAMFMDSLVRLNLLWALIGGFFTLVVLLAFASNNTDALVFIVPALFFGIVFSIDLQTRNEDDRLKDFALLHTGALVAKKSLQVDGIDVVDLPDKTMWSAALLKKFKVLGERSRVTSVAALCKPQCTELQVWRDHTVRVVDLKTTESLYAR